MNFWFTIREGFKGFKRARLSSVITISSVVFSHVLIAIFILISINIDSWMGQLRSKVELEAFLELTISDKEAKSINEKISKIRGVQESRYISRDDAAKRFEKEFGKSVYEVLQANPLPASIIVLLNKDSQNTRGADFVKKELSKIEGIEDVIYQKELISVIDNYMGAASLIAIAVIVILITITFILLYNTIRLTIYARRDIIEIMKLVGAKKSLIKRPFVIEGFLQGIIGSSIACVGIYMLQKMIISYIYPYLTTNSDLYFMLIIMGSLIGYLSSRISVQKHLGNLN